LIVGIGTPLRRLSSAIRIDSPTFDI
jgi:hypothetical protein